MRDRADSAARARPTWAWASRVLNEYPGARYAAEVDDSGRRLIIFRRRGAPLNVLAADTELAFPDLTVWASVVYALDLTGALSHHGPQPLLARLGSAEMDATITAL